MFWVLSIPGTRDLTLLVTVDSPRNLHCDPTGSLHICCVCCVDLTLMFTFQDHVALWHDAVLQVVLFPCAQLLLVHALFAPLPNALIRGALVLGEGFLIS